MGKAVCGGLLVRKQIGVVALPALLSSCPEAEAEANAIDLSSKDEGVPISVVNTKDDTATAMAPQVEKKKGNRVITEKEKLAAAKEQIAKLLAANAQLTAANARLKLTATKAQHQEIHSPSRDGAKNIPTVTPITPKLNPKRKGPVAEVAPLLVKKEEPPAHDHESGNRVEQPAKVVGEDNEDEIDVATQIGRRAGGGLSSGG